MRLSCHPRARVLHNCIRLYDKRAFTLLTSVVISVRSCTRSSPLNRLVHQNFTLIGCNSTNLIQVLRAGVWLRRLNCLEHVLKIVHFDSFLIMRFCWRHVWYLIRHGSRGHLTLKLLSCYALLGLWGKEITFLAGESRDRIRLCCGVRRSAFD